LAQIAICTHTVLAPAADRSGRCSRRPFAENLEASPTLKVCGVTKMLNDEWIRTLADGRNVKFSHDELIDATFITAQIEGNEVVYSILLKKAETKLSREEVEGRFKRELSRK
jgi:hypothetical protein